MRRILVVSATTNEIEPFLSVLSGSPRSGDDIRYGDSLIATCVTGAGMVPTAFALGAVQGSFYAAINAGVAGTFNRYGYGEVVNVTSDTFSELGAQDDEAFIGVEALGLGERTQVIADPLRLRSVVNMPVARGITVNTVHGHLPSIARVTEMYQADIESMEGAAFIYSANRRGWKALQLRAVSNMIERRNRDAWQLGLAIRNLNDALINVVNELASKT